MRQLSVLLLVCVLFLSLPGNLGVPANTNMTDCCKQMQAMGKHQPAKQQSDNSCSGATCPMFLSCSVCGFVVRDVLRLQPVFSSAVQKPVIRHTTGNPAGYYPDNWKPPKTC